MLINSIYGVECSFYSFGYLHECICLLSKFIELGWLSEDMSIKNSLAGYFKEGQTRKLFDVIRVISDEIKRGNHDLYQVNHGQVNVIDM